MNIVYCCDIVDDNHPCFGDRLHGGLCLPKLCQCCLIAIAVAERSNLHVVKRKISLTPEFSPTVDKGFLLFKVKHPLIMVGFPLVPEGTSDRETDESMDHAVVEHGGILVASKRSQLTWIARTGRQYFFGIDGGLRFGGPILDRVDVRRQSLAVLRGTGSPTDDRLVNPLKSFHTLESNRRSPWLNTGTTPRRINDADGYIQFLMQLASHVITASRKVACSLRRADLPTRIEIV